jgi:hypothetical protein
MQPCRPLRGWHKARWSFTDNTTTAGWLRLTMCTGPARKPSWWAALKLDAAG